MWDCVTNWWFVAFLLTDYICLEWYRVIHWVTDINDSVTLLESPHTGMTLYDRIR